jgi:hypothetical protein
MSGLGQFRTHAPQQRGQLFDHLVDADQNGVRYRRAKQLCRPRVDDQLVGALRSRCCPNAPARKVPRSIHEHARDMAREIAKSWEGRASRRLRKKVEMLFAHLKRILKLDRLRLRGPNGAHDEFLLAATAQNLRKLAKLIPIPNPQPAQKSRQPSEANPASFGSRTSSTQSAINRHRAASCASVNLQVWHRARYTKLEDVQYP